MSVKLIKVTAQDIETVWKLQVQAFQGLLATYHDDDISPATDTLSRVEERFAQPETTYYFIEAEGVRVGVIRVIDRNDGSRKRISPLWIMEEYRGKGYAHDAMKRAEEIHGKTNWCLDTILQEKGNIHLYEKMGYHQTGRIDHIKEGMDIVYYEKD